MDKINTLIKSIHGSRVYFDTNPIIYFVEQNDNFIQVIDPIFNLIGTGDIFAYTSELTLAEILIKPFKDGSNNIISAHKELLLDEDFFRLTSIDRDLLMQAAEFGGKNNTKLPDAIHMVSAMSNDCQYFITNDKKFRDYGSIKVIQLSELAS
jgi:predicted nucleic acid-binding protein